jgi:hypothetical protein
MNPQAPARFRSHLDYLHLKPAVLADLRDGLSVGAIHRARNVPEHAIKRWRDEAGIAPNRPGTTRRSA